MEEREARRRAKELARNVTKKAIRGGGLAKQPCEECGATERVEVHHVDYTKPLEIRWLCKPCHYKQHAPKREALRIRAGQLRSEGRSYAVIGRELGVGKGTAYKWLNPVRDRGYR